MLCNFLIQSPPEILCYGLSLHKGTSDKKFQYSINIESKITLLKAFILCNFLIRDPKDLQATNLIVFFFKKWANLGLFFVYFRSFQTNNTIFTTNQCEKCPSSIWRWDSNPRPLEHESPPITTRPGLPPTNLIVTLQAGSCVV